MSLLALLQQNASQKEICKKLHIKHSKLKYHIGDVAWDLHVDGRSKEEVFDICKITEEEFKKIEGRYMKVKQQHTPLVVPTEKKPKTIRRRREKYEQRDKQLLDIIQHLRENVGDLIELCDKMEHILLNPPK